MSTEQERILVVESDPEVSDLISRQALQPLGYRIKVVGSASEAIQQSVLFSPHLVIASLDLPDLSGKDLLVALSSQGIKIPIIMIAEQGMEEDVIQAFRLGASDYMLSPVREAELVSVVERALKQTRARREREQLARQLRQTNQELQRRVRELTTIFAIGKAVTSITDQSTLFDRIVEGAVFITDAKCGWVLVRKDDEKQFYLRAHRNLPKSLAARLNHPWDDGISSLVAISGESLAIHGNPLKRFPIARLGKAALVVPVRVQGETIGILVVLREEARAFSKSDQTMLEAVADYASISLANTRLFHALEDRARSLQKAMESTRISEQSKGELIQSFSEELRQPLSASRSALERLLTGDAGSLKRDQEQLLRSADQDLQRTFDILESMQAMNQATAPGDLQKTDLNALARQSIRHNQHVAQQTGLALLAELPTDPVYASADANQIKHVFDGLITNAVKFSPQGGQITIRVEEQADGVPRVTVRDTGIGIAEEDLTHVFDTYPPAEGKESHQFSGLGIRLAFVKNIITAHRGEIWVESEPGKGSAFIFTLQPVS